MKRFTNADTPRPGIENGHKKEERRHGANKMQENGHKKEETTRCQQNARERTQERRDATVPGKTAA